MNKWNVVPLCSCPSCLLKPKHQTRVRAVSGFWQNWIKKELTDSHVLGLNKTSICLSSHHSHHRGKMLRSLRNCSNQSQSQDSAVRCSDGYRLVTSDCARNRIYGSRWFFLFCDDAEYKIVTASLVISSPCTCLLSVKSTLCKSLLCVKVSLCKVSLWKSFSVQKFALCESFSVQKFASPRSLLRVRACRA